MKFMKHKPFYIKSLSVIALSCLTMANTKCDKKPEEARQLKKNIKVVGMSASSFLDNSGFNFSETAQSQLSGVFFENNYFFERNTYPSFNDQESFPVVTGAGVQKIALADANQKAQAQLQAWFPNQKTGTVNLTRESSCLISRPQHLLLGKINALEAYSGGQLQFGFNSNMSMLPSAKFKLDKMRMDLSMHAFDPWTQEKMGSVNSEVFKKDYSAGFGIDLGILHIGLDFYRVTGMAEVTLAGLKQVVQDISTTLKRLPRQEWQTRVLFSRDNYVVIVGGAELGLKKGDRLKIENEVHDWLGEPCGDSSVLQGSVSVTSNPWIVEIEDAGNLMSKAKVLNIDENTSIDVGALVRVDQLYVEPAPEKKK